MRSFFILQIALIIAANGQVVQTDSQAIRIGLALSGGAALGLAHIGVLKVLQREGIPISYISGNSIGALVGGVYAAGYSAAEIESIVINANWSRLFSANVSFGAQYLPERQSNQRYIIRLRHRNFFPTLPAGLFSLQNVEFYLMQLLSEIEYNTFYNFDSLPIPYRAVAVDLISGERIVLKQGRLSDAIRASVAIPGVFSPLRIDGQELVDGGVQQCLPVDPLYDYEPDFIIAVLTMKHKTETGISLVDVISRSMDLVNFEDLWLQKNLADIVIEPNVDPFNHSDFLRAKELIEAGEAVAESLLPEIRAKLAGKKIVKQDKLIKNRPSSIVRSVQFEGLRVTRKAMLMGAMHTVAGKSLDFKILHNDLVRLFNFGLFEEINYGLKFSADDSVDVIIKVQEKAYGFYSLGIRYDNVDNVNLGFEAGQGNLGGSGASVRMAFTLGNPNECRLGLTGTRLFRLPFGYRLDGFWGAIEHSYYHQDNSWQIDYLTIYRGGVAEAGYIIGQNAFFNIGMKAHEVIYRFPPLPFFDSLLTQEWLIGPSFNLEFNNFDDLQLPTNGISYRFNALYSNKKIAAANDFIKIAFSFKRVRPVFSWLLSWTGLEFGMALGKLSWAEYFRTGGEDFVGFARDEFTTEQQAFVRLGFDFRLFNLFNNKDYPMYLQLYSNLGSFEPLDTLLDGIELFSVMDWGVGTGLRTNTPVGPLKLICGVGDFAKPESDNLRFNFAISVGREFRYTH